MRTLVRDLKSKIGQTVKLYLTLETLRDQKHLQFILAKDKSGLIQLVISKSAVSNHVDIGSMLQGSNFIVVGKTVEAQQSKTFGLEIQVEAITIVSKAEVWPISADSSIDLRFDFRVVDLKQPKQQLMLKLRSAFLQGAREYLLGREFTEVSTPKLMGTHSESGSECFSVDYFGGKAYLSQSPQFFKEAAVSSGLDYFEIGPVFRAEGSTSSRHLTEFTGLDVEFSWCFETEEVMKLEEEMLLHALSKLEPFKEDVRKLFNVELTTAPKVKYLALAEAKSILRSHGVMDLGDGTDLPDEGERMLYEILQTEMIFISDYPISKRPFYHMWEREKGTTKSFDLIFKGIEITSGAIRQHDYEIVKSQALEKGLNLEPIKTYLDNFKYGCPPHGGFGIGVERVISRLLGITVKESSFMPRDPERLIP